jgi:hypothetical protein
MRKFAANYLISEAGIFLKNGVIASDDDGTTVQYYDTKGDLRESSQLIFHNGILIAGYMFVKTKSVLTVSDSDSLIRSFVLQSVIGLSQISIYELIELGKLVQNQFQEMKIPEILIEITEILQTYGGFSKENLPGVFLLIGADLSQLHFTPKTRLKKIL